MPSIAIQSQKFTIPSPQDLKARRWNSSPTPQILRRENVQAYLTAFDTEIDAHRDDKSEAVIAATPAQIEIYHDSTKPKWLTVVLVLPSVGSFSIDKVQYTWQALAAHNPILRTVVTDSGSPDHLPQLKVLSNIPRLQFDVNGNCHSSDEMGTTQPHLVFSFCETGEPIVTLHIQRILVDQESIRLIQRDFGAFYTGKSFAEHTPFRKYVEHVMAQDTSVADAYWRKTLDGTHHESPLLHGSQVTLDPSNRVSYSATSVPGGVEALARFRERTGFDRTETVQAAWAIVLGQHESKEEVIFAYTTRDHIPSSEAETVVGRMEVSFPLRIQVGKESKIWDVLETLKHSTIQGMPFAYQGFKRIGEQTEEGSLEVQSCLKVMGGSNSYVYFVGDDEFPVTMRVTVNDAVHLTAQCDNQVPAEKVLFLLDHCMMALENVLTSNEDTLIGDADLVGPAEKEFLLEQGLPGSVSEGKQTLVHALFEKQAILTPTATALEDENGRKMTYAELNCVSNQVAKLLPLQGLKADPLIVPVCFDRANGIDMVVSLLALLKAGAAYVILDPEYPEERKKFIIKDVGAPFVLTEEVFKGSFENPLVLKQLILDAGLSDTLPTNLRKFIPTTSAAYVIYTSGSTGHPKGVILEHGAATSGLLSAPPTQGVRSLLFYNPVFSASQRTIFGTLTQGGTLCLSSKESLTTRLSETIAKLNVNAIGVTSTTASLLNPDEVPSLKRITLTGEKVTSAVVNIWASKLDIRTGYGLSECTQLIWNSPLVPDRSPNNIGRPSCTTNSYVLVPGTTNLAPVLVAGELCLAGPQLARGYLNRDTETKQKFVENPFGEGMLYRTGDMAICLEDGSIEILGRIDMQVKIAGQRVEPSEVAAVIRENANVADVAVPSIKLHDEVSLVACIVLKESAGPWSRELHANIRRTATESLPAFAIPSFWVVLDRIPTNSNGKVDFPTLRKQLESLGREGLVAASHFVTTNDEELSETEKGLRGIWSSVLELDPHLISVDDSFLSLGGSSMRAIQVATACREHGWDVAVADIIRSPSLRSLATTLTQIAVDTTTYAPFSLLSDSARSEVDASLYEDAYPTSALQEALVAASLSGNPDYLYQRTYNIEGVDVGRLKESLDTVFKSSHILRTTFLSVGSGFVQAVTHHALPWVESSAALDTYKAEDAEKGVTLGELFFRIGHLPSQNLLVISAHHALFDFWSNSFIIDDAAALYNGTSPTTRAPFSSFIRSIVAADPKQSETFWQGYLDGANTSRLGVIPDERNMHETKLDFDIQPFLVSNSLTSGSLVYAAWAFVLASHNASDDVTFATTLSGRDVAVSQIHSLDGPTLTTVPQRVMVDRKVSGVDFVRSVQDNMWEMNKHSQYGMRNALRASGQSSALFDTLVNLLIEKEESPATREVFKPFDPRPAWNTEFITLEGWTRDDVLHFRLNSDLQPQRGAFVLEQFVNTVKAIVASPSALLCELDIISDAEHAFLNALSPPVADYTPGYLHAPLERHAAETPNSVAIQWLDKESITYSQLNSRANCLAALLREKGVTPESVVPLCLEKSPYMIISLLGVLKAGGAYAPMDPDNPPERNNFIVSDVEAKVVIADRNTAEVFAESNAEIVIVEDLDLSGEWPDVPVETLTPDNLAYIIYTSGSTGLPKGVLIPHGAVSVAIETIMEGWKCDKTWRTLMFSNYVFDVSVSDMFTAFGTGATLCLAPTDMLMQDLASCINSMNVTHLFLTPTVAKFITPAEVPQVQKLMVGGEALPPDVANTWASKVTVVNSYGPTETSILVTLFEVPAGGNHRIIGKPFKTAPAVVLDKDDGLKPVPYGAMGELCFGGPQLSRGYLKRPEVTEKAFVYYQGERIYRSGDLVRWLPDGTLECFGRKDSQVKISGHRIELGEIESAILATDAVFDCAVTVVSIQNKPQLVAFVAFSANKTDTEDLFLSPGSYGDDIIAVSIGLSSLPPYMVPKIWVPVTRLPLNPSGKADRKRLGRMLSALDALEVSRYSSGGGSEPTEFVEPTTSEEKLHQELWASVLGVEKDAIGATSSFFTFGGDSISAINLVSKCRKEGYLLAVGDVLAFPTLQDMAARMKPLDSSKAVATKMVYNVEEVLYVMLQFHGVSRDDIEEIYPAGPGQSEFLTRSQQPEQFWQLHAIRQLPDDLDFSRWLELTIKLTEMNPILRTMYMKNSQGGWMQVVLRKPIIDLETVYVKDEEDLEAKIQADWQRLFELGKPFVRYRLLVLPDGRRNLMMKLDHGSYDGTLFRVFDAQFTAMAKNQPPPTPIQFHSFVDHINRADTLKCLSFWENLLRNNTFSYPESCIYPVVNNVVMRKADSRIDSFAAQCGVTVPIVYQTAFTTLLARLSGRTDVSYDNLVTGRDIDMEDPQSINGTCANFIPFRSSFSSSTTVKDLLKETQTLFWKTTENGIVSLSSIYDHLGQTQLEHGNKNLFIFQPFEPATGPVDHMRWCVMAMSRVRQPVNYAIMFEVYKTAVGYSLRLKYDGKVYEKDDMEGIADMLVGIVEGMMTKASGKVCGLLG